MYAKIADADDCQAIAQALIRKAGGKVTIYGWDVSVVDKGPGEGSDILIEKCQNTAEDLANPTRVW